MDAGGSPSSKRLWYGFEGQVIWSKDRYLGKEPDRQPGVPWIMTCHAPELVYHLFFHKRRKAGSSSAGSGQAVTACSLASTHLVTICLCDKSGLSLLCFLFSLWWFLSWEHINLVLFSVFITIFVTQVEHQNVNASYLLWRIVEFSIALTFPMFCISIGSGSWWLMIITIITPRDSKYKLPNVQRKPLETFNRSLNNLCPNVRTSSIRHPSVSGLGEIQPRLQPEE